MLPIVGPNQGIANRLPRYKITTDFLQRNPVVRTILEEELAKRVVIRGTQRHMTSSCIEYTGAMTNNYGIFSYDSVEHGFAVRELSHRLSYILNTPTYDGKKQILHKCENKICCNPDHLLEGTARDNQLSSVTNKLHDSPLGKLTRKVSMPTARNIRQLYENSINKRKFIQMMADSLGVSYTTIRNIVKYKTHLEFSF